MSRRAIVADVVAPVAVVLLLAGAAFALAGTWPPVVAVESGSMEPHTSTGDLVILTAVDRFPGPTPGVTGADDVAPGEYERLGGPGDVIVFDVPGSDRSPILHRVAFRVEAGENWYDRADPERHDATGCADLRHCPAPHDGYVTYGDSNGIYDQAGGIAPPVREEWILAKAQVRVPKLGWVRIVAGGAVDATSGERSPGDGPSAEGVPGDGWSVDETSADGMPPDGVPTDGMPVGDPGVDGAWATVPVYTSPSSVMESVAALRSASERPNSPGEMATVRMP